MSGGSGTRFWPRSRQHKSKQFLPILGRKTLISQTIHRFGNIAGFSNVYIIAKKDQASLLHETVPQIPSSQFIFEPEGKDTAPCIGLSVLYLQKKDPEGVVLVSPSDHLIGDFSIFKKTVRSAEALAKAKDGFVTIGIVPDRPATGYGYIQLDEKVGEYRGIEAFRVKTFAEKPTLETAKRFLETGDFLWNSGIFVFRIPVFLKAVEEFLPDLYDGLMEIEKYFGHPEFEEVVTRVYRQIRRVSIDFGIMEKASNVFTIRGQFRWNDLGSWEQLYRISPKDAQGNRTEGEVILLDTENSYVASSEGLVAVVGLENVVVVHEGDVTLVCKMDRTEDVKQVVDRIARRKLEKYL